MDGNNEVYLHLMRGPSPGRAVLCTVYPLCSVLAAPPIHQSLDRPIKKRESSPSVSTFLPEHRFNKTIAKHQQNCFLQMFWWNLIFLQIINLHRVMVSWWEPHQGRQGRFVLERAEDLSWSLSGWRATNKMQMEINKTSVLHTQPEPPPRTCRGWTSPWSLGSAVGRIVVAIRKASV